MYSEYCIKQCFCYSSSNQYFIFIFFWNITIALCGNWPLYYYSYSNRITKDFTLSKFYILVLAIRFLNIYVLVLPHYWLFSSTGIITIYCINSIQPYQELHWKYTYMNILLDWSKQNSREIQIPILVYAYMPTFISITTYHPCSDIKWIPKENTHALDSSRQLNICLYSLPLQIIKTQLWGTNMILNWIIDLLVILSLNVL